MQLDHLVIETRVRSGWSAIDLGITLARRFWLRSVCLYLLLAVPVYLLTRFFSTDWYFLSYVILWWMKPVFERPILFLLSRELFSESTSFKQTVFAFGQWIKPGLFWILTLRRLSFLRSMHAPITLLERPKGKDYGRRTAILGSKVSRPAFWLTMVLFHIEAFMVLGIFVLIALIAPEWVDLSFWLLESEQVRNTYEDLIALFVVASIAPFYVASGFMLYISRRVELEGWDIEMCFRDWMNDKKASNSATAPVANRLRDRI